MQGSTRKSSLSKRDRLVDVKSYNYTVSVHTAGDFGKKLTFMTQVSAVPSSFVLNLHSMPVLLSWTHCLFKDEEQASFWKSMLENAPSSRFDTARTVSLLKKSLEGMRNQSHDEPTRSNNNELAASAPIPRHHRSPQLARAASDMGTAAAAIRYRAE